MSCRQAWRVCCVDCLNPRYLPAVWKTPLKPTIRSRLDALSTSSRDRGPPSPHMARRPCDESAPEGEHDRASGLRPGHRRKSAATWAAQFRSMHRLCSHDSSEKAIQPQPNGRFVDPRIEHADELVILASDRPESRTGALRSASGCPVRRVRGQQTTQRSSGFLSLLSW